MCSIETKKRIYDEFDNGLEPQQVIVKLNIPEESKVVHGCYTYYKKKKSEQEEGNNFLLHELEYTSKISEKQINDIISVARYGRELISSLKEAQDVQPSKKIENYNFARQILVHDIENNKESEDVVNKIRLTSKIRRNYKYLDEIEKKVTKIKKELNQVVTLFEGMLPFFEVDESNGTELFINNRTKNADDYCLDLISAIRN